MSCMNSYQGKRMKPEDDNSGSRDLQAVSKFLEEEANEDILFEIFVRLPNCRVVVLLGSLNRRWHSLISQPIFVTGFISHPHKDRCPPPYTIIFCESERCRFGGSQNLQPLCSLFSPGSISLHGGKVPTASSYLNFLPAPEVVVRASCGDLLLVSPDPRFSTQDLYICNPVTRKHRRIPPCPLNEFRVVGHALLVGNDKEKDSSRLDVLLLSRPRIHRLGVEQRAALYRSGSVRWELVPFHYPRGRIRSLSDCPIELVVKDGVVYFLAYASWASENRVVYFDPTRGKGGVIKFPGDFVWWRLMGVAVVGGMLVHRTVIKEVRHRIGVVVGGTGLRLVQAVVPRKNTVCLRVWELVSVDEPSWVLVHAREYREWQGEGKLVGVYVHPTDGSSVIVVWAKGVFRYDLTAVEGKGCCEMVGELRETLDHKKIGRYNRLTYYPMVHPAWPTPVSTL